MTARHILVIFVALLGTGVVGAVITSAVRRIIDWQDRRAYVPPAAAAYIEVRPVPLTGEVVWAGRTWADRSDSPRATVAQAESVWAEPASVETFRPDAAALAILVALIAQAAEHEAQIQRAVYREPAAIWCQVTAKLDLARA